MERKNSFSFYPQNDLSILNHVLKSTLLIKGFSDSSVGKQSACNAEDPGSIPGSGRSGKKGISYPLQYSWASLVAQLVKNPPARICAYKEVIFPPLYIPASFVAD